MTPARASRPAAWPLVQYISMFPTHIEKQNEWI